MLEYIDENLMMILQNPDKVLYLKPFSKGAKIALFAVIREESGVYRKVQITKEQSKLSFPVEPLYWFFNGPGYIFLNDFLVFNNYTAVNITNLDGFMYKKAEGKRLYFNSLIFATFNDGLAAFVTREREKSFKKNGGIKYYLDLLEQYKKSEPQGADTYEIIERYIKEDNDIIVIPSLLKEPSEKQKIKN